MYRDEKRVAAVPLGFCPVAIRSESVNRMCAGGIYMKHRHCFKCLSLCCVDFDQQLHFKESRGESRFICCPLSTCCFIMTVWQNEYLQVVSDSGISSNIRWVSVKFDQTLLVTRGWMQTLMLWASIKRMCCFACSVSMLKRNSAVFKIRPNFYMIFMCQWLIINQSSVF